jgi:hypothetical protein
MGEGLGQHGEEPVLRAVGGLQVRPGVQAVNGSVHDCDAGAPGRRVAGVYVGASEGEARAEPQVQVGSHARFEGGGAAALREEVGWRGAVIEAEGGGGGGCEDVE